MAKQKQKEAVQSKKPAQKVIELKGVMYFKAGEGKVFPVVVAPKKLKRITDKTVSHLDFGSLSYEAKNEVRKALMNGDLVMAEKGGK
jgi:hypothetical protein